MSASRFERETNEVLQITQMLKQKPEIDEKITFYKGVLKATADLIESIQKRIDTGFTTETGMVLFMPFRKRVKLDSYDVAKLEIEKYEAQSKLDAQKRYFETWLSRSKEYEVKFAEITAECNANYDAVYAKALEAKSENKRLADSMDKYKNDGNDQKIKNEYYLFLKYEISRAKANRTPVRA